MWLPRAGVENLNDDEVENEQINHMHSITSTESNIKPLRPICRNYNSKIGRHYSISQILSQ